MAPITSSSAAVAEEFDVIQNRIAIAFAERERLIKSWTNSSLRPRPPPKTQEQLDAEDAELFHLEPPHLGLGAIIPKDFLEGDVKRKEISSNDKLRHLILGKRSGFQASKPRDILEKAGSAKRGLKDESSDDDEGRSGLGKAKKVKHEWTTSASVQGNSSKVEMKRDSPSPIVSTSTRAVNTENFVRIDQKLSLKKIEIQGPEEKHTAQSLKKDHVLKKPLVDYTTDDDDNNNSSVDQICIEDRSVKKIAFTAPKIINEESKTSISENRSNAMATSNASVKGSTSSISSSKLSSTASLSDSEPSDIETVIPMALTSDILPRPSLASPGTSKGPEQRRERNRLKKAKRREKKQRERELALVAAKANSSLPSSSLSGAKVKLKDRLLDANGN